MALPASPTDIFNLSLDQIGEAPVTNIDSPVSSAEFIGSRTYDTTRTDLLREIPWHFAKTGALINNVGSAAVTPNTGTPPQPTTYDFTDAYSLPDDFIRLLSVAGWAEELLTWRYDIRNGAPGQGLILCCNTNGAASINIRYIQDVPNVTLWDSLFRKLMIIQLAVDVCFQITKDRNLRASLLPIRDEIKKDAAAINGQERPPIKIERSKILRARRTAGTDYGIGDECGYGIPPPPSNPPSGTVTSVSASSAVNALSFSGGPITLSGTLLLQAVGTLGQTLYFSNTNTLSSLNPGTNGQVMTMVGGVPGWTSVGGTGTVTSVGLTISAGLSSLFGVSGSPVTGAGSFTLNTTTTTGDILYASASNSLARLGIGSTNQVLTVIGGLPSWQNSTGGGSGTVTSVGLSVVSGLSSFLSVTGTPVTVSGTLGLALTCAAGDMLYGSAANTLSRLTVGSSGAVLVVSGTAPAWGTSSVAAGTGLTGGGSTVGGTTLSLSVPVAATSGGTAQSAYVTGDTLYASATNTLSRRTIGSTGNVLTVSGGIPVWAAPATSGTVTSVSGAVATSASNIFSITGSPITVSGTLTLAATIAINSLVYASAANVLSALVPGTSGQVLTIVSGVPTWSTVSGTGTVTSVAISGPGSDITWGGTPITTSGTLAGSWASQAAGAILCGPVNPTASAAAASFKPIDRVTGTGGASGLRALPTSGALTGDYYNNGAWTQTGAITATDVRIFNTGAMTFNNTFTVTANMLGGVGANGDTDGTTGGRGAGQGGGSGGTLVISVGNAGGAGGSFGGLGGQGGGSVAAVLGPISTGTYPIASSLYGSGGGGGSPSGASGDNGGNGGNGGGGLYIEATGNITFASGTAMTANGGAGVGGSGTVHGGAGGGGTGGGIQVRCLGTATVAAGASITSTGGAGGTDSSSQAPGGGGSGGIIDISSSATTNSGTVSAGGGAAGTGGNGFAAAGATGVVTLNSFLQGPRAAG